MTKMEEPEQGILHVVALSKTVDNYLCSNSIDIDNNINEVDNFAAMADVHVRS